MSKIFKKLTDYRKMFGEQGPWLLLKTRFLSGPTETSLKIPGFAYPLHLRLKSSDIPTFKKIFNDLEYDFPLNFDPKTIVDAGANVGFASIFFARKFPSANILAIEPELSNFALLEKNTKQYSNITSIRAALWKEDTELNLVDPEIGPWGFQAQAGSAKNAQHKILGTVPAFTISKLMEKYGLQTIDLLKVDIEGGEHEVFENSSPWISKVNSIMIELHEHLKPGCSNIFNNAVKAFPIEKRQGENVYRARN